MKVKKIILLLFLFKSLCFSQKIETITLQLDWLHQYQFAGYYIAKEKGYYKQNGLDVKIKEFNNNIDLIEDTLKEPGHYAIGKSSLIIEKLNKKPITLLLAIYQNSPMVLLTKKNSGINSIEELANKKIMLTEDAKEMANIISMIRSQGIKSKTINFIPHSFKLDDLIDGTTDAMACYLSNEPYLLTKKKIKYNIFNPADYGFDFYGGILFTSENEIKNNLTRVKNFYDATLKGWNYAFKNIEETAKMIYEKYNTQNKTLDSLIYEGNILKKLAKYEEGLLGNIDTETINEIKRLYLLLELSKNTKLNTDTFIFDKNKILFNNYEKNFLKNNSFTLEINDSNMPFSFTQNNKFKGLEVDLWKTLAQKLNTNFNIIEEPKDKNILKHIQTNDIKFKFVYQNKQDLNTSIPLNKIKVGIATINDKNFISDLIVLKNKRIAVIKDKLLYEKLKKEYPEINFLYLEEINEGFKLLKSNEIFAVIDNILMLSHSIIKNNYNNIKIAGTLPYDLEIRLKILDKNVEAIGILNKIISKITNEEKRNILNKYQLIVYKEVKDYSWFYKYVIPLLIMIIFSIYIITKMRKEIKKRKIAENTLLDYANKDSLTKILNRRKIEKILSNLIKDARLNNSTFSIIFIDIDNFKSINDTLGHLIGDKILVDVSKIITSHIRKDDLFGRWGGEEFIIILPNTSSFDAKKSALHLKEHIEKTNFEINRKVTASFGITEFIEGDNKKDIVLRADKAMYHVKKNGKNNIKIL
ncbi:transporter substrate-binding domain-containing diguanylate cyclase [Arcobacter sp. YIC-310]|uniref:transporter substrate-binding domain-containing diguanylate cyclase n=1 Tax=Arcobacter sp. YIC-310 TaxID=3376632 RepID=UPI003C28003F